VRAGEVSKAFTRDESDGSVADVVTPRPPLPSGTPNYVTPRGLALLNDELARLESERGRLLAGDEDARRAASKVTARIVALGARIASAVPVDPATHAHDRVCFGACVRVRAEDGSERSFQIVGVDEADVRQGRIAFVAPLARALLGARTGDTVTLRSPGGVEDLEVIEVRCDAPTPS
jgi:transcription elongation factor GreB